MKNTIRVQAEVTSSAKNSQQKTPSVSEPVAKDNGVWEAIEELEQEYRRSNSFLKLMFDTWEMQSGGAHASEQVQSFLAGVQLLMWERQEKLESAHNRVRGSFRDFVLI